MPFFIVDCSLIAKFFLLRGEKGLKSGIVGPLIEPVLIPHLPVNTKRDTGDCRDDPLEQGFCFVPRHIHTHSKAEGETAYKIWSIGYATKALISAL